ncbi:hypothetical protein SDC9_65983 [bioreactor metagenome]|uniref:Uncharacterized protein n=1 Tax=bioreactor metagenome TaxID=1076179 RepID=A0A644XUG9_9ZZZZ
MHVDPLHIKAGQLQLLIAFPADAEGLGDLDALQIFLHLRVHFLCYLIVSGGNLFL